jgi:hypothetical protein
LRRRERVAVEGLQRRRVEPGGICQGTERCRKVGEDLEGKILISSLVPETKGQVEVGYTSMNSESSLASLGSSISALLGLVADFLRPLPRAFRVFFVGCSEDFSIKGVERQSRKIWKLESSEGSIAESRKVCFS